MLLPHRVLFGLARLVNAYPSLTPALEVTRLQFQVKDLPEELIGFCIAQVSDFHVGNGYWLPFRTSEAAEVIHAAGPEVAVNCGDYMQWDPPLDKVLSVVHPFVDARATNIAILGNHDYRTGPVMVGDLTRGLQNLGMIVLVNRLLEVRKGSSTVIFAGLTEDAPGFEGTVNALAHSHPPRIVLVHEPDLAERLPRDAAELILAGHTHGGQVTVPFVKPTIVRVFSLSRYEDGLHHVNGTPMYVNRGLGCTGVPFRFRSKPEVTLIRLVR